MKAPVSTVNNGNEYHTYLRKELCFKVYLSRLPSKINMEDSQSMGFNNAIIPS